MGAKFQKKKKHTPRCITCNLFLKLLDKCKLQGLWLKINQRQTKPEEEKLCYKCSFYISLNLRQLGALQLPGSICLQFIIHLNKPHIVVCVVSPVQWVFCTDQCY